MRHTPAFLLFTFVLLTSCKQSPATISDTPSTADTTSSATNKTKGLVTTCYMSAVGKDTFLLQVKTFDNVATGDLSYLFHEKDRQTGTFNGHLMGDTLIGDYLFQSEGTTSSRQIAFLLSGDKAIEGYGDVEDKNGEMVFKDIRHLQFGKGLNMLKVTCQE